MGPEAAEVNRHLVSGQTVYLKKDASETTDRYGRLLRYVFLPDGTFVNADLVRLGYAQVSTYPPHLRYQSLFSEMEGEARVEGYGLSACFSSSFCSDCRFGRSMTPVPFGTQAPIGL